MKESEWSWLLSFLLSCIVKCTKTYKEIWHILNSVYWPEFAATFWFTFLFKAQTSTEQPSVYAVVLEASFWCTRVCLFVCFTSGFQTANITLLDLWRTKKFVSQGIHGQLHWWHYLHSIKSSSKTTVRRGNYKIDGIFISDEAASQKHPSATLSIVVLVKVKKTEHLENAPNWQLRTLQNFLWQFIGHPKDIRHGKTCHFKVSYC